MDGLDKGLRSFLLSNLISSSRGIDVLCPIRIRLIGVGDLRGIDLHGKGVERGPGRVLRDCSSHWRSKGVLNGSCGIVIISLDGEKLDFGGWPPFSFLLLFFLSIFTSCIVVLDIHRAR